MGKELFHGLVLKFSN